MLYIFSNLVVELDIQDFSTTPCIKAVCKSKEWAGLVSLSQTKLRSYISNCLKSNGNKNLAPPGGAKCN